MCIFFKIVQNYSSITNILHKIFIVKHNLHLGYLNKDLLFQSEKRMFWRELNLQ